MPCYNRKGCWDKIGVIFSVAWMVYHEAVLSLSLLCFNKIGIFWLEDDGASCGEVSIWYVINFYIDMLN